MNNVSFIVSAGCILASLIGFNSCSKNTDNNNDSVVEPTIEIEPLTEDVVTKLFTGLPDHGYEKAEGCTTPEFYKLIQVGFEMPSDCPGGIGEDEWRYYWVSGQDADENSEIKSIEINISENDSTVATAKLSRTIWDNIANYEMNLVAVETNSSEDVIKYAWRVDDLDGNKAKLVEYINNGYKIFKKDSGNDVWENSVGEYGTPEEKAEYLKSVADWLNLFETEFPDGIAK